MEQVFFHLRVQVLGCFGVILAACAAMAQPQHGIAMYGAPALPPDFVSLPYVNADAPKGGAITLGNTGTFNSLNPYAVKGTVPWQLRYFTHDSLMGRSLDEPFTLYGLLAESIETPEDRKWVEFTLREEARFSDGSPVTVEDVIWSYETLGTEGHPRYHTLWKQIETIEATGPRKVRLTFAGDNRELALIAGLRPILKKAQWDDRPFGEARLDDLPIGSGPYQITKYETPRYVELTRNPDYWGKDVPVQRGMHNFDSIRIDFFGDGDVMQEAFRSGLVSAMREFNAEAWARNYDFPRAQSGDVVKTEISHHKPTGMTGFVMNTRRAPFDDWRVRQALIHAFNFEYINDTLTGGGQPRISSYFGNSVLAYVPGPAEGKVAELLAPFADTLLPNTMDGYAFPASDGTLRNRAGIRAALRLFEEAGWTVQDGIMSDANGTPFTFSILLDKASSENRKIADIYIQALERLGVVATIDLVDDAQFVSRTGTFDFDLAYYRRALSLSPGTEQRFYWGSDAAQTEGSRNLMGVRDPAVDALIDTMLTAPDQDTFVAATRALDRVLTAGRYVIPFWSYTGGRIAHVRQMKRPEVTPIYGDGPAYMPHVWWWSEE